MFLTRNKLKKIKKPIDDDDMLNYLKYAHINHNKSLDKNDLEFDMIRTYNKSTQTDNKQMEDKQIGVGEDELTDEFIKSYILNMKSRNFSSKEPSRLEKETQANTIPIGIGKGNSKSPPPSDDNDDGEGFGSRSLKTGFRLAKFAFDASITGINIAEFLWNMTAPPEYDINYQANEEQDPPATNEQPSASTNAPNFRERSRSRDDSSDDNMGHRLLRRGASKSRSNTPSSGTASSAKTTPRKKSK